MRFVAVALLVPLTGCLLLLDAGDGLGESDDPELDAGAPVGEDGGDGDDGGNGDDDVIMTIDVLAQTSGVNGTISVFVVGGEELQPCSTEGCLYDLQAGDMVQLDSSADVQSWNVLPLSDCPSNVGGLTRLLLTVNDSCTVTPFFIDPADV